MRLMLKLNQSETNAAEMPRLSIQDRGGVIGPKTGVSDAQVSEIFNFNKSIYRLINKYNIEGIIKRINASGKPHKTTAEVEHSLFGSMNLTNLDHLWRELSN